MTKFDTTRWKRSPSKYGLPLFFWFVFGSVHSFSPVASPTKFATVSGASSSYSSATISPLSVSKWIFFMASPLRGQGFSRFQACSGAGGQERTEHASQDG